MPDPLTNITCTYNEALNVTDIHASHDLDPLPLDVLLPFQGWVLYAHMLIYANCHLGSFWVSLWLWYQTHFQVTLSIVSTTRCLWLDQLPLSWTSSQTSPSLALMAWRHHKACLSLSTPSPVTLYLIGFLINFRVSNLYLMFNEFIHIIVPVHIMLYKTLKYLMDSTCSMFCHC